MYVMAGDPTQGISASEIKTYFADTCLTNGVQFMEPIPDDSTGILLESMLEGNAEYYSADLAEKVNRGMTDNALKCKSNGGTLPLGYFIDHEKHGQL